MKKKCLLYFFIVINVFTALYAGAYSINGHIPGQFPGEVVVTLSGDAGAVTVTDKRGYYEFTNLPEGGSYTITPSKSYTPPGVTIVNPGSNDSLIGSVTLTTDVTSDYCGYAFNPPDITISSLDNDYNDQDFQVLLTSCCFVITNINTYIDNTLIDAQSSNDMCLGTYTYPLNTPQFSNGLHTIRVVATDDNGGTGSEEITVVINNDTTALIGDVNIDGVVNIVDALNTAQYYVANQPAVFDTPLGDVNLDKVVNIIDALLIAQYYVGLLTELPENKPGGYSRISTTNTHAVDAYTFFEEYYARIRPGITLGAIKLAFSQVVSGINVRLIVSYYSAEARTDQFLLAIIYLNLDMVPEQIVSTDINIY